MLLDRANFFQQPKVVLHAPMARDARSNLLKTQLLTMIKYGHTLLLLAAPPRPFLGKIEAVTKMSSSSEKLAFYVCVYVPD